MSSNDSNTQREIALIEERLNCLEKEKRRLIGKLKRLRSETAAPETSSKKEHRKGARHAIPPRNRARYHNLTTPNPHTHRPSQSGRDEGMLACLSTGPFARRPHDLGFRQPVWNLPDRDMP